jgi:hypothetical protein
MSNDLEPGKQLTIVRRSDPPAQWVADIVAVREDSVALRLREAEPSWSPEATYLLICGKQGSRLVAPAAYFAHKNTAVAFKLRGAWKPLDLRKDRRFQADMQVEVRSVLGTSRQPGRLVDISMGGLAVAVDSRPGGSQLEVRLWAGGYSAQVVCDVVRATNSEGSSILHLRFHELAPPQAAFIRQLIASLLSEESLAS